MNELPRLSFFSSVNWEDLLNKRIQMPYRPKLQGEMDISSFETTFTNEKPIDSVPEPDLVNDNASKKNNKNLLNMFGYGSSSANPTNNKSEGDVFRASIPLLWYLSTFTTLIILYSVSQYVLLVILLYVNQDNSIMLSNKSFEMFWYNCLLDTRSINSLSQCLYIFIYTFKRTIYDVDLVNNVIINIYIY
jgi:hypothetical protein